MFYYYSVNTEIKRNFNRPGFWSKLVAWVFFFIILSNLLTSQSVLAASVTAFTDQPSTLVSSTAANHKFTFTLIDAWSDLETITLTFPSGYTIGTVDEDDFDLTDDGVDLTTASNCDRGDKASITVVGQTATFVICANFGGAMTVGSVVTIEIGLNASFSGTGADQIINPTTIGTYDLTLSGTSGNSGVLSLPTISPGLSSIGITVTGATPTSSGGSSGGSNGGSPSFSSPPTSTSDPIPTPDPIITPDPTSTTPPSDPTSTTPTPDPTSTTPTPDPTSVPDPTDPTTPAETPTDPSADTTPSSEDSAPSVSDPVYSDSNPSSSSFGNQDESNNRSVGYDLTLDNPLYPNGEDGLFTPNQSSASNSAVNQNQSVNYSELPNILAASDRIVADTATTVRNLLLNLSAGTVSNEITALNAITLATATVIAASSFGLLSFLQYLWLLPGLFFRRRHSRGVGYLYNPLSNLPIGLATVRIFTAQGQLVTTLVSSPAGEFPLLLEVGEYQIKVMKSGFRTLIAGDLVGTVDDHGQPIYRGEIIKVDEASKLDLAIPLLPINQPEQLAIKSGRKFQLLRQFQSTLFVASLGFSLYIVVLQPTIINFILLISQLVIIAVLRFLKNYQIAKSWSLVGDQKTRFPIGRANIRVFEMRYNKLVQTMQSDRAGRFGLYLGGNQYFYSVQKEGYQPFSSPMLDLTTAVKPKSFSHHVWLQPHEQVPPSSISSSIPPPPTAPPSSSSG